ncbi:hypothetical protein FQR65_LT06041 [Abscondita terminalis]|nr:hypothetical protein FQR65_LT06041 [Abscondita terminalis]
MLLSLLILQLPVLLVLSVNIPSYVKLCHKNDPDLGNCILKTSNDIIKHGHEPIPEMDLPILDPLQIETISIDTDGSSIKVHLDLIECVFENVVNAVTTHVVPDLENVRFSGQFFFPSLAAKSKYKMEGRILNFDIQAEGSLKFDSKNVTCDLEWYGSYYTKNDKKHIQIDRIETKTDIKEIKLHFYKLFGDNEALTESVNAIINENIQDIKKDLDSLIEKTVAETIITYFNRVYKVFPVDELYLDD